MSRYPTPINVGVTFAEVLFPRFLRDHHDGKERMPLCCILLVWLLWSPYYTFINIQYTVDNRIYIYYAELCMGYMLHVALTYSMLERVYHVHLPQHVHDHLASWEKKWSHHLFVSYKPNMVMEEINLSASTDVWLFALPFTDNTGWSMATCVKVILVG